MGELGVGVLGRPILPTQFLAHDLKYAIVFARPSCNGTFGSQPRSSFASVISGLRRLGSSDGMGR